MSIASLYPSINPSLLLDFANSKVLDPRITFTRTTTATYYDGVTTAKAEENLVLYSQEFDNAYWTKTDTTITANSATTAPDGTTTADLLYPNSTGTDRFVYRSSVSGLISTVYTFSFYAKASGINWVYVGTLGGGTSPATCAFFDLQNGVVGQTGSFFTSATITSVGNSWYRCIVIGTTAVASIFPLIGLANANNSSTVTASGTNGVLLWGAQLEQRSSATAYTATTTQAITNYIPVLQTAASGVARFDHNPTTGESLGLLIEEARTNSLTYSAQFDNAAWNKIDATVTMNTVVAPDGTLTGDKVIASATNNVHVAYVQNLASSGSITISVFAKAGEYTWLFLSDTNSVANGAYFNLATGALGTIGANATATITSVGNGWYRCTVTITATAGSGIGAYIANANGGINFTGNGFSGVFLWGAQVEAGSFATSYIPTVASSVTRNADAASMTGTNFSSWFAQGAGTLYAEYATLATTGGTNINIPVEINNGAQSKYFNPGPYANAAQTANVFTRNSSSLGANSTTALVSRNGSTLSTYTDAELSVSGVTQLLFGTARIYYYSSARVKKVAYYPIVATQAQINALTT